MIAAQMQRGQGKLLAMDIHGFKCEELLQTSRRYGIENLDSPERRILHVFQPGLAGAFRQSDLRRPLLRHGHPAQKSGHPL